MTHTGVMLNVVSSITPFILFRSHLRPIPNSRSCGLANPRPQDSERTRANKEFGGKMWDLGPLVLSAGVDVSQPRKARPGSLPTGPFLYGSGPSSSPKLHISTDQWLCPWSTFIQPQTHLPDHNLFSVKGKREEGETSGLDETRGSSYRSSGRQSRGRRICLRSRRGHLRQRSTNYRPGRHERCL